MEAYFPGGQVAHHPAQAIPDHADKESVIFDEWLLGEADEMIGTYASSITFIATARRRGPSFQHTNTHACLRTVAPMTEPFFPGAHAITLRPYDYHMPLYTALKKSVTSEALDTFMREFSLDF